MPDIGRDLMMLAYPDAPQRDLRGLETPVVCYGRISAVDKTLELAAADQHAGNDETSLEHS
jgi:hypothetical protein